MLEDWLRLRVDVELVHCRSLFGPRDRVNVARMEGSIEPGDVAVLEPAQGRISTVQPRAAKGRGRRETPDKRRLCVLFATSASRTLVKEISLRT